MLRILGIFLLLGAGYWLSRKWSQPQHKAKMLWSAVAVVLLLLLVSGRLNGLALVFFGLLAMLYAHRLNWPKSWNGLAGWWRGLKEQETQPPPMHPGKMTREQALKILGLNPGASEQDVIQAHRRLIAKLHPDSGGSDYLAAQINLAKKALLRP